MFSHAHGLFRICGTAPGGPVLLLSMLVAGLGGSTLHCVPMCGPFVIGQVTDRLAAIPVPKLCELSRLRSGLLIPYHAGRLLTYAGLGAVVALAGGFAMRAGPWPALLLAAAGLICAVQGLRRLTPSRASLGRAGVPSPVGRFVARMGAGLDRTRASGTFVLGVLLGFLPCGLLYAALAAASATGTPAAGAAAMAAFGLGTVPALAALGVAGRVAARARVNLAGRAGGALMLLNAAFLWRLAAQSW